MPDLTMGEIVFWILILLILYTLRGYPLALRFMLWLKRSKNSNPFDIETISNPRPMVSFILAAYNEENNIAHKITDLLEVEYPPEKTEFIIGSDFSSDATDEIIMQKASQDDRIKFFRMEQRSGKIAVLHRAVESAKGSILIFTDCSVRTKTDFMPLIISGFADEKVGLISSQDIWVDETTGSPTGQHKYIEYEMKIRQMESDLCSLVSASGSFFAVRKKLFKGYGQDQADDFALPLQVFRSGFRVVHCPQLIGYVPMVGSSGAELSRRSRIITAGINTIRANIPLLFSVKHPLFAWQLWSHKVLKWLLPFFVIMAGFLSVVLWREGLVYNCFGLLLLLILMAGLIGLLVKGRSRLLKPLKLCSFVLLSMMAALSAWANVLTGTKSKIWEPSHR